MSATEASTDAVKGEEGALLGLNKIQQFVSVLVIFSAWSTPD
jgi:hypothetical protein